MGGDAAVGQIDNCVGEAGEFGGRLRQIGEATHVPEEDPQHLPTAEVCQVDGGGDAGGQEGFEPIGELVGGVRLMQRVAGAKVFEPVGVLDDFF